MNILDQLTFTLHAEAQKFTRFHVCALCLGELIVDDRNVKCPEHGQMYQHTVTERSTADQITNGNRMRQIELDVYGKPKRTPEEILKELGY